MEEIIEYLQENREPLSTPLTLPDHEDLLTIEEALLLSIPTEFRRFLLNVSDIVYGYIEPATASDPNSHTYLAELASQAWNIGLPRDVLPVCEYKGGYASIDQEGRMAFWKDGDFTNEEWESIWHWTREIWLEGKTI